MNILNSASKLVFIIIAIAIVGLTLIGIVEPKDFVMLAGMTFSFYFTKSPTPDTSTTTSTTTSGNNGTIDK